MNAHNTQNSAAGLDKDIDRWLYVCTGMMLLVIHLQQSFM